MILILCTSYFSICTVIIEIFNPIYFQLHIKGKFEDILFYWKDGVKHGETKSKQKRNEQQKCLQSESGDKQSVCPERTE